MSKSFWLLPNRQWNSYDTIITNGQARLWKEDDFDLPMSLLPEGWSSRIPDRMRLGISRSDRKKMLLVQYSTRPTDKIFFSISSPLGNDKEGRGVSITFIWVGSISEILQIHLPFSQLPESERVLTENSLLLDLQKPESIAFNWFQEMLEKINQETIAGKPSTARVKTAIFPSRLAKLREKIVPNQH